MTKAAVFIIALCIANSGLAVNLTPAKDQVVNQLSGDFALLHEASVTQIYAANNNQLIWLEDESLIAFENLLEVIAIADLSDHFYQRLIRLKEARMGGQTNRYDILATDTLLSYISYTELSVDEGKAWYFGARLPTLLPEPSAQAKLLLMTAIKNGQITDFIRERLTVSSEQQAFNTMLDKLLSSQFIYGHYLQKGIKRKGDYLEDKAALVERLAVVGINTAPISLESHIYDLPTEQAVIQFQQMHGLKPDGIIGPNTMDWLNTSIEERARILALNSERLRLWNLEPEDTMVVNVPDFRLRYRDKGENYFESKVIVGRESRKTPLINTNMDAVILNPSWNVPRTIMVNDILPAVKRDTSYLEKNHYEILKNWRSDQTVDPNLVDWQQIIPKNFPYHLRQNSGPTNALGRYKFNTPNRNAIYLHDTPSKHLFNQESRAFSSGCIRVQDADKLADLLVNSHTSDRVRAMVAQNEEISESNYTISLSKRIPVQIIYQTAWIESGQVQYRTDVYHYDSLNKSSSFEQKFAKLSQLDKLLSKQ